jgi:hypothetical protein
MKIAICISGFVRTWKHTRRSFEEQLLKGIDYDLFLHIYRQNLYEFTADKQDENMSDTEINELFSGLNVKSLIIEDRHKLLPILLKDASKYSHISNYNLQQKESSDSKSIEIPIGVRTYDHLRKIHLCNELRKQYEKENNIKYDLVVKTRFDLVYFNSPNWKICLDNKVHFGFGATFGWPDDTFCICTPEIMDTSYANRFILFDEMFLTDIENFGICAHKTLSYILNKNHIEIGDRVVNMNCFRSENSLQYYSDYRRKCNLSWLYEMIVKHNIQDIYIIENLKRTLLGP